MSVTPVSSSDEDIGGVPSIQSSYSASLVTLSPCRTLQIVLQTQKC